MKKISLLIASTVIASTSNAFIINIQGSITGSTARSSLAPSTLVAGSASGSFNASLDMGGVFFNGGILNISYNVGIPGDGGSTNTYSNLIYNLSSTDYGLIDSNYNGTGKWLVEHGFGFSESNTTWITTRTAPSRARNTNGSYLSNSANGFVSLQSGTTSCTGSCSIFTPSSFGIEGLYIRMIVDQDDGFRVLDGQLIIQEVSGTSSTLHQTIYGDFQQVPIPAAAWLMGSGLLGLVGLSRRKIPA